MVYEKYCKWLLFDIKTIYHDKIVLAQDFYIRNAREMSVRKKKLKRITITARKFILKYYVTYFIK